MNHPSPRRTARSTPSAPMPARRSHSARTRSAGRSPCTVPSASGSTTVGEALNILERYDLSAMTPEQALHHYLEASALAFADRGAYVGDPAFVDVPVEALLDDTFARERACSLDPARAATKPVAAGDAASYDGARARPCRSPRSARW